MLASVAGGFAVYGFEVRGSLLKFDRLLSNAVHHAGFWHSYLQELGSIWNNITAVSSKGSCGSLSQNLHADTHTHTRSHRRTYIYIYVHMYIHVLYIHIYLASCLSIYPSICLSTCMFIYLPFYLSVEQANYISFYVPINQ